MNLTSLSLEIFAFFMLTGVFSTLLLPETKGLTLEDLSAEDQDKFDNASTNVRELSGSVDGTAHQL